MYPLLLFLLCPKTALKGAFPYLSMLIGELQGNLYAPCNYEDPDPLPLRFRGGGTMLQQNCGQQFR